MEGERRSGVAESEEGSVWREGEEGWGKKWKWKGRRVGEGKVIDEMSGRGIRREERGEVRIDRR